MIPSPVAQTAVSGSAVLDCVARDVMHSPFHRRRFDSPARLRVRRQAPGARRWGMGSIAGAPSPMASAIAAAEGFGSSTAIPTIANNPGDLELGDQGAGVTIAAGGQKITNFATLQDGWNALQNQINLISSGQSTAGYNPSMSISQVGALYSGDTSGAWANNVATNLGTSPDTNFAAAASGVLAGSSATNDVGTDTGGLLDILESDLTSGNTPLYVGIGVAALAALAYFT